MRRRRYTQIWNGDGWRSPRHRNFRMACCACGLVHAIDFRVVKLGGRLHVQWRVNRHERATAAARRGKCYRGLKLPKQ